MFKSMTSRLPGIGLVIITLISFSSCNPHFYRPRSLEPVLLTHEKQLTVNIIASDLASANVAYSPLSHLGIQAGIGGKDGSNAEHNETYFTTYISSGYYKMISSTGLIEIYGGAGAYNYKNKFDAPVKSINFSNYFLQPSFAVLYAYFDVAFSIRADYLKRNKTVITTTNPPDISTSQYSFLKYNDYIFIQPGITISGGIKEVKFQLQFSKSFPSNNKYNSIYGFDYDTYSGTGIVDNRFKMGVGIRVDLGEIIHRRDTK